MKLFHSPVAFQAWAKGRKKLGLVPTMGALHEGHLSLVRRSKSECGSTAVSIFVNPTQFAPGEDYKKYPRGLARDLALLKPLNVDAVLIPSVAAMYPEGFATEVKLRGSLIRTLEGKSRPNHFDGVSTVVAKLFALAAGGNAYFGQKDYQQLLVVRRMAADLNLGIRVVSCATVRERDGLALSSRNAYLDQKLRLKAPVLYQALKIARLKLKRGSVARAKSAGLAHIRSAKAFKVDYFEIRDAATLDSPVRGKPGRILVAAWLGNTRLIDNIHV